MPLWTRGRIRSLRKVEGRREGGGAEGVREGGRRGEGGWKISK